MRKSHAQYAIPAYLRKRALMVQVRWVTKHLKRKFEEQSRLLRERLVQARVDVRFSQALAAAKMGRDQTFISKIEAGIRVVSFCELEHLAINYGKELS